MWSVMQIGLAYGTRLEAEDRSEGHSVRLKFIELAEGPGAVVCIDVDGEGGQDVELPADAGSKEGIGKGVVETIGEGDAHAHAGVEPLAHQDKGEGSYCGIAASTKSIAIDFRIHLEAEEAPRNALIGEYNCKAVVFHIAEGIVADVEVVDGAPEMGANKS